MGAWIQRMAAAVLLGVGVAATGQQDFHAGVDRQDAAGCAECHGSMTGPPGGHHPLAAMSPATLASPRLPLADGRMTCLTCHDLTVSHPGQLRLPMAESALCRACHRL